MSLTGNDDDPDYRWTCGTTPDIEHDVFIGCGGYGEVHRVRTKN